MGKCQNEESKQLFSLKLAGIFLLINDDEISLKFSNFKSEMLLGVDYPQNN